MSILVVGFGNTLRGDDGAGPYVARRVGELRADVLAVEAHQLAPELAVDLADADVAFFVDARAEGPERGIVVEESVPVDGGASTHHVSPGSLLTMARALFGRVPRAYLVSLPTYNLGFSDELTPEARAAAEEAVGVVIRLIDASNARVEGQGAEQPGR